MTLRRAAALALLGLYAFLSLLRPSLHLAHHSADHNHRANGAIDWSSIRTRDGHVNLAALARQLGLETAQHEADHRSGRSHEHPDKSPRTDSHGEGASEHFGVALLSPSGPVAQPPPSVLAAVRPAVVPRSVDVGAPPFLTAQRAQAPPIV